MLKDLSVLYVEDDSLAQEFIKLILEDEVKELYQAYDGEEGLKKYQEVAPDIIVTDINMPNLDGLSMAKIIKKQNKEQPIVILSAFDDKNILIDAINTGIDNFILKPIDVEKLLEKLNLIAEHILSKQEKLRLKHRELEDLQNLAFYDPLTKVPNRVLFEKRLDEAIKSANYKESKFALFFIDLDNFKEINDTFGHLIGDEVLQYFAKSIMCNVRLEDTFARISGDEFALIVEEIQGKEDIEKIAQKLTNSFDVPFIVGENKLKITCSIGVSCFPSDADEKQELIHLADVAMYRAKQSGKARYVVYEAIKD